MHHIYPLLCDINAVLFRFSSQSHCMSRTLWLMKKIDSQCSLYKSNVALKQCRIHNKLFEHSKAIRLQLNILIIILQWEKNGKTIYKV